MNRNLVGVIGALFVLAGGALPFARLEQASGDVLPLMVGFVTFVLGAVVLLRAIGPTHSRRA